MHDFFVWVETSSVSTWVRESPSLFAFPGILSLHTIGMGLLAGINGALDLRMLGIAPQVPLTQMGRFLPVMWIGFWVNAVSGVLLLIGYPTKALTNPVFYAKLTLIAIAVVVLRSITRQVLTDPGVDERPVQRKGRLLAAASLVCWIGVIFTGRFLAYTYVKLSST